ncbi:MAG: hypothetical protein LC799_30520, partial [Actinobacteria bacterium]|nr:hypothetical protein [Actinomycetota bacterium]
PPSPATPGSGCLQLHFAATTTKRWTVSHLHPKTAAPRGALESVTIGRLRRIHIDAINTYAARLVNQQATTPKVA